MKAYIGGFTKKGRRNWIRIDGRDLINLDHTLALIILPALRKYRKGYSGAPLVDNEDIPDGLQAPDDYDWSDDLDEHYFPRWEYVLDEMIYAFQEIVNDDAWCSKDAEAIEKRVQNGLRLFGKYYQGLWQ